MSKREARDRIILGALGNIILLGLALLCAGIPSVYVGGGL